MNVISLLIRKYNDVLAVAMKLSILVYYIHTKKLMLIAVFQEIVNLRHFKIYQKKSLKMKNKEMIYGKIQNIYINKLKKK